MKILGWFFLIGLAWAADEKVNFILPQQIRSSAIPIETKTKSLEIEGHEVGFEVIGVVLADRGVADLVEGDAHVLDDGLEVIENVRVERLADAGEVAALVGFGVGMDFLVLEVAEVFK